MNEHTHLIRRLVESKTDSAPVPEVIIAERKTTYWKCPHCKQEIHEKHAYSDGDTEVHGDCGGRFRRPPPTKAEQAFIKQLTGT